MAVACIACGDRRRKKVLKKHGGHKHYVCSKCAGHKSLAKMMAKNCKC